MAGYFAIVLVSLVLHQFHAAAGAPHHELNLVNGSEVKVEESRRSAEVTLDLSLLPTRLTHKEKKPEATLLVPDKKLEEPEERVAVTEERPEKKEKCFSLFSSKSKEERPEQEVKSPEIGGRPVPTLVGNPVGIQMTPEISGSTYTIEGHRTRRLPLPLMRQQRLALPPRRILPRRTGVMPGTTPQVLYPAPVVSIFNPIRPLQLSPVLVGAAVRPSAVVEGTDAEAEEGNKLESGSKDEDMDSERMKKGRWFWSSGYYDYYPDYHYDYDYEYYPHSHYPYEEEYYWY